MAVADKENGKLSKQPLNKPTGPALRKISVSEVCVGQHQLLRVLTDRTMEIHNAVEVVSQGEGRCGVSLGWSAEHAGGRAKEVIVEVRRDDPNRIAGAKEPDKRQMEVIGTRIWV